MILTTADVWQGWTFAAHSLGLERASASKRAIAAALKAARELADAPELEAPAIFYAFARRPSAFPRRARYQMLWSLTSAQARFWGEQLQVNRQSFQAAALHVAGKLEPRWSFERLAREMEAWLVPL
jgi:hypothetical protein